MAFLSGIDLGKEFRERKKRTDHGEQEARKKTVLVDIGGPP